MTRKSNGNSSLTLTQTTIGNLLGPFISTALIQMYTSVDTWYTSKLPKEGNNYAEIYRQVFKSLGLSVFLPLVRLPCSIFVMPLQANLRAGRWSAHSCILSHNLQETPPRLQALKSRLALTPHPHMVNLRLRIRDARLCTSSTNEHNIHRLYSHCSVPTLVLHRPRHFAPLAKHPRLHRRGVYRPNKNPSNWIAAHRSPVSRPGRQPHGATQNRDRHIPSCAGSE
jgi:hypothetical protein